LDREELVTNQSISKFVNLATAAERQSAGLVESNNSPIQGLAIIQ